MGVKNGAVDVDLGVQHGNSGRAGITGVIDVGDIAVEWDLGLFDEEDGAGAFYFVGLGAISAELNVLCSLVE